MRSRAPIEQAKGILMARYTLGDEAAFAVLRRWSMAANVKVRDLAVALVELTAEDARQVASHEALAFVRAELDG